MNLRLKILLPLGILILVLVTGLSAWSIYQLGSAIQYERNSKMVEGAVQSVYRVLQETESAQRKFLLTAKPDYETALVNLLPKIPHSMERLGQLVQGDTDQEDRIDELQELIDLKMEELKIPQGLPDNERGRLALAIQKTEKEEGLMREIHGILDDLDQSAKQNARLHEAFARKYTSVLIVAIMAGSAVAIFLVLVFAYMSRREIAVRTRTEKDLKAAQEAALIASRLKSQFLATVSHEIRTPLNGIIGMSDLLKQRIKNPEQRHYLEVICGSGEALLRMVNDILDFAKVEAGRIEFEITEFSVLRTIEQVIELFSLRALEKQLVLATHADAKIPLTVAGDGARVSQILSNLVGNAVKFTARGGIFVGVRLLREEEEQAWLRFEVSDSGPGIEPNLQPLLFQPFNSFKAAGQKFEGSGLGLSICKNLVEQMHGRIGLDSRSGEGSTFWFEIPLRTTAQARIGDRYQIKTPVADMVFIGENRFLGRALQEYANELSVTFRELPSLTGQETVPATVFIPVLSENSHAPIAIDDALRRGHNVFLITPRSLEERSAVRRDGIRGYLGMPFSRELFFAVLNGASTEELAVAAPVMDRPSQSGLILLAEDNVTNQILAKAILEDLGYNVHTVANGQEVLEALSRVRYDLILMDGQMPVMDGLEATRQIRINESKQGRHTPIVAMTANASDEDRQRCLAVGMDDFLAKPFKSSELQQKLERLLGIVDRGMDWQVLQELERQTNKGVVARLISSFLNTLPQSLARMETALNDNNLDGVRSSAHHLKSSAGALGATRLADLCRETERLAVEHSDAGELKRLVSDLLACGRKVESELKAGYQSTLNTSIRVNSYTLSRFPVF